MTTSTEIDDSWKSRLAPLPGFISRPDLLPAAGSAAAAAGSSAIKIQAPAVEGDGKAPEAETEPLKLSLLPPGSFMGLAESEAGRSAVSPGSSRSRSDDDVPVLSPIIERDEDDELEDESQAANDVRVCRSKTFIFSPRVPGERLAVHSSPCTGLHFGHICAFVFRNSCFILTPFAGRPIRSSISQGRPENAAQNDTSPSNAHLPSEALLATVPHL